MELNNADASCQGENGAADVARHWHTQTSLAAKSGDFAFVRGCSSQPFDVSIGASYADRGMRNDDDTVQVSLLQVPTEAVKAVPREQVKRLTV